MHEVPHRNLTNHRHSSRGLATLQQLGRVLAIHQVM